MTKKKKLLSIVLIIAGVAAVIYLLWWNVLPRIVARSRAPAGSLLETILSGRANLEKQAGVLKSDGYKDNYFVAEVTKIGVLDKELDIEIHLVGSGGYYTVDAKTTTVQCPQEKTTLASSDFVTLTDNVNLLDEVEVGDIIWAYCLDDFCSTIGKECILVKN